MENYDKLADLLLPDVDKSPADYEALYPPRGLPEGARVTRIAPSPTGYLHLGVLFTAMCNKRVAATTGGVFYLRIEDTDKKREVEGGIADIVGGLTRFGVTIDEGFVEAGREEGAYGPYQQSKRGPIYRCFAKELIKQGLAYPCFCTEEELAAIREEQEAGKIRTGYHGKWARCRDMAYEEVKKRVEAGEKFVVRLRSPGSEENRVTFDDGIKGKIQLPENDEDFVILKSDGIPTYHFAHVVDDHLMRTTHVIRGDEWISSTPKHLQLFRLLGWKPPKYAHVAPIMKEENGGRRKLSKRKDPEAAVRYYIEAGYPPEAVIEYLMTVASSDFEDWRRANKTADLNAFKFNLKKMSVSGALFDLNKLRDVSKNYISLMDADRVTGEIIGWARDFDPAFYDLLAADPAYTKAIFSIDRDCPKPRKDIAKWDEAKTYAAYFFDGLYTPCFELPENLSAADAAAALTAYMPVYDPADGREAWFQKIKDICPGIGFSPEVKEYKKNPAAYKGHAGDVSTVIRIAVTGRRNTPDLCSIMQLLGKERCMARMEAAKAAWQA
ncbi:MAG TPA: glutamate--tRNA ligase [Firmicutes bacterium]|nr:glutamate--tRNA ligase [Bacillota bacterium]